jgi:hypothetical protein
MFAISPRPGMVGTGFTMASGCSGRWRSCASSTPPWFADPGRPPAALIEHQPNSTPPHALRFRPILGRKDIRSPTSVRHNDGKKDTCAPCPSNGGALVDIRQLCAHCHGEPHVIEPSTIPTRCRQVLFMLAHFARGESDGQERNTSARDNHRPV